MAKILVLFTGGTIASIEIKVGTENGKDIFQIMTKAEAKDRGYNVEGIPNYLIDNFNKTYNRDITFETKEIADYLSENMTISKWNGITDSLRKYNFSDYDGVIITHGTDTLGYFANYLSTILGDVTVPIVLVSSNYHLKDEKANGHANFQAACDFIRSKEAIPGVYATYRNTLINENKTRLIYGSRLLQCSAPSNDFESISVKGNMPLATIDNSGKVEIVDKELYYTLMGKNKFNKGRNSYIYDFKSLNSKIMMVEPYVGIDYNGYNYKLYNAILHTLYHSGTACTDKEILNNIINFYRSVRSGGIDFYAGPFYGKDDKALYATSADMIKAGIKMLTNTSKENAYAKLLVAYTLASSYEINENQISEFVDEFMFENINHEYIQAPIKTYRK